MIIRLGQLSVLRRPHLNYSKCLTNESDDIRCRILSLFCRFSTETNQKNNVISVCGCDYIGDDYTNVTPHILNFVGRNLHLAQIHPLSLLRQRITNFMYKKYVNRKGNPLFSAFNEMPPVVNTDQNFDSLLIPADHVTRQKSDTYYINRNYVLRTHTSAHQKELISSGLDNFLVIGDVYRRDSIDVTHYPVFHQAEAVRLFSAQELFRSVQGGDDLKLFENGVRSTDRQECHSNEAVKWMEHDLKDCLSSLVQNLFGSDVKYKWTDSYFPFTHPSWELEVLHGKKWLEVLGCGIMEQQILQDAGAGDKVGWAFGLGLERLAMMLYSIPDIRFFWSQDTGFLSQFNTEDVNAPIKYKPISKFPQCTNDISFWIPANFHSHDFFEIVRCIGGEMIEQVYKIDEFFHPKHKRTSVCFRIVYRHMERTLVQAEVNEIHSKITDVAIKELNIEMR